MTSSVLLVLDFYGEKIIISRTVTQSSSSYKLKDQQGRVVVERKAKEELDRILARFNIQVSSLTRYQCCGFVYSIYGSGSNAFTLYGSGSSFRRASNKRI